MNNKSKLLLAQAISVLLASMIGLEFLNASAQSQPIVTPTPTPTPKNPLLQPTPVPIPTRDPSKPIFSKPITDGASIDVSPEKKPPAAIEFQGPGDARTRIGPVYIDPKQGRTASPGQGESGKPQQGGAGLGVNVTH